MKIFLAWSGEKSKAVATKLRTWLEDVVQQLRPWMSQIDIDKGIQWRKAVETQLKNSDVVIVCITKENVASPWINFEAGTLFGVHEKVLVCPYLIDLSREHIKGPFEYFQCTTSSKEDTLELLKTLNSKLEQDAMEHDRLVRYFAERWDDLDSVLRQISMFPVDDKNNSIDLEEKVDRLNDEITKLKKVISSQDSRLKFQSDKTEFVYNRSIDIINLIREGCSMSDDNHTNSKR